MLRIVPRQVCDSLALVMNRSGACGCWPTGLNCSKQQFGPLSARRKLTGCLRHLRIIHMLGIYVHTTTLPYSHKQVPQHKTGAKDARRPKHLLRRAASLCSPLELLVAASYILLRVERVFHELVNVRGLHAEIACQSRLQLRDLCERFFRGTVPPLARKVPPLYT